MSSVTQQLGRYEILEQLGRGAMGTVFKARDPRIGRIVAIKTVTVAGATPDEEEEYRKRFVREAQAAGKLSHSGIVTIHDIGEDGVSHTPFIVMEYIDGQTLESWLTNPNEPAPTVDEALRLTQQIAEALHYAHSQHIVHRDIKPANIMVVGAERRTKIADFGIAKLTQSDFTAAGQVLGTPSFMSPEQLNGEAVDGRSDIFSLGVILYWMLTGVKPFTGSTTTVLFQVACQTPAAVTERNPLLNPEHDYIACRALAKDPNQRYSTAQEFADDLGDLQQGRVPRSKRAQSASGTERTLIQAKPTALQDRTLESRRDGGESRVFSQGRVGIAHSALHLLAQLKSGAQSIYLYGRTRFDQLPRAARIAVLSVLSLAILAPVGYKAGRAAVMSVQPSVPVQVRVSHSLRSADLSIWADGNLVLEAQLTGASRRQLFRTYVQGSYSNLANIPAGKRVIKVRVSSEDGGVDQSKEIQAEFVKGTSPALVVNASQESLYVSLRD